jgi:uncharacterized membrane protein (DUF4010 family)
VLISGVNFASYILVKALGAEHGIGLTGLLGGLASSTAVSLGFAQRSRTQPEQGPALVVGILLAWSVMFFRVVLLVAVIAPALAWDLAARLGLLGAFSLALAFFLHRRQETGARASVSAGANPFELGQAIRFGLLFGVVTFVARAAQVYLGDAGLYLAGALAGLTDIDPIALSMAQLAQARPASLAAAGRTIVIAVLTNTFVKGAMAIFMGAPALRRVMLPSTGVLLAAGALVTLLL